DIGLGFVAEVIGPSETPEPLHPRLEAPIAAPFELPLVADLGAGLGTGAEAVLEENVEIRLDLADLLLKHGPDLDRVLAFGVVARQLREQPQIDPILARLGQREDVFPLELIELVRLVRHAGRADAELGLPP